MKAAGKILVIVAALVLTAGCQGANGHAGAADQPLRVLAAETFLADIAQHVAGDRLTVDALIPLGVDPHGFEPTPADVRKVADSDLLIVNGAGFESFLERLLQNADGERTVVEASAGLTSREPQEDELCRGRSRPRSRRDRSALLAGPGAGHHVRREHPRCAEPGRPGRCRRSTPPTRRRTSRNSRSWTHGSTSRCRPSRRSAACSSPTTRASATLPTATASRLRRRGRAERQHRCVALGGAARPAGRPGSRQPARGRSSSKPARIRRWRNNWPRRRASSWSRELLTHSVTAPDGPAPDYIAMIRYNVETIVAALK